MSERERRPGRSVSKGQADERSEGKKAGRRHHPPCGRQRCKRRPGSLPERSAGRGTRPIAAEAPGTLFMSRSEAEAYKMLKAADAGRWRSRGGAAVDGPGGAQRSLDWTQRSGVKARKATASPVTAAERSAAAGARLACRPRPNTLLPVEGNWLRI